MNITYIIGNGFDLTLGLPTSYKHFYRYYKGLDPTKDSKLIHELKDDIRQYEEKNWSDLEAGLGKFTTHINKFEDFEEIYLNIHPRLTEYIRRIENTLTKITRFE